MKIYWSQEIQDYLFETKGLEVFLAGEWFVWCTKRELVVDDLEFICEVK